MSTAIALDLGPAFYCHRAQINGEPVCALTPRAFDEPAVRQLVQNALRQQGIDCRECRGCPVGTER
ncbi:hypothetical protein K701_04140 [Streptomyces fradiae ATCC 10745 = DSM 40063]|uniref:Uncharacterized protein n=1 Tax=Streptomyces fradiae ATCC 10745 = DSM 40063 TaxID=1319510 RepID=A0A1Y2NTX4_STRFR|nr:hypothetical protein [Streptomyces fradiae]KAF0651327.1 hypothetical protein K701_04140 [Streptomyces fradiae ATCC 10745 = DSM 40063]OSY50398.1 hypothetical protein BG846_03974 [Streptomyces fradiae ATCC 10745 = DSM 40063]QEV11678.1 hypothetical protein CP974_06225 [Streptomyces fradiae ATCC 10745 = DSM 40063]